MKFFAAALIAAMSAFGLSACKQQASEQPAPEAVQDQAQQTEGTEGAQAPADTETTGQATTEGAPAAGGK